MPTHPTKDAAPQAKRRGRQRANIVGLGSDETAELDHELDETGNALGINDRNAKDKSPNKFLIDDNKNTKPRDVSHPAIPSET